MQFFRETHLDFVGWRRRAFAFSSILILAGVISLVVKGGPKLGIDFKGGMVLQVAFQHPVTAEVLRSALDTAGYGTSEIVNLDKPGEFIIKYPVTEGQDVTAQIKNALSQSIQDDPYEVLSEELVGPKIGRELGRKAIWATVISLGAMLIYIGWRFEFRFAVAAVLALFHDVAATVGVFSITNREISLPVIAALLTLVGYSINDTIVVFDRIREDLRKYHRETLPSIINASINETLSRTVITALTVFMVLLFLYFLGGEVLRDFSFALLFGVVIGTYSSIFVASPIVIEWDQRSPMRRR
jgi:preprotein translocase SecF subunit